MPSDEDDDGWLSDAIETGAEAARTLLTPFGTEREVHTCPDCGTACEPTHTYDPARAAFDGGQSPAWTCPDCGRAFVREADDEVFSLDLYGRDPPE